tara:strand:+ start:413 stop:961 length:549 start_codon:yes stop_codon:yes gene_type:complete
MKDFAQIIKKIEAMGIEFKLRDKNTELQLLGNTDSLNAKQYDWLKANSNRLIDFLACNNGGKIQEQLDKQTEIISLHKHPVSQSYYSELSLFRLGDDPSYGQPKPKKEYPPLPTTSYENTREWSQEQLNEAFKGYTAADHKPVFKALIKSLNELETRVAVRLFIDGQISMAIKYAQNRQQRV